jgi:multiple sugar transport system substrate-binding protein
MRRKCAAVLAVLGAAVALAACGSSSDTGGGKAAAKYDGKPVTISFWTYFSDQELDIFKRVVDDFHKHNPKITVNVRGGVSDDKLIAAARGGNSPDLAHSGSSDNTGAFCSSHAWITLKPYLDRDKLSDRVFPPAVRQYTQYKGNRCALPVLSDVYGLYYNKDLLAKAGVKPPKTFSELAAAAKKLTQRGSDGTIQVAGYVPTYGFYEVDAAHNAPQWDAHWQTAGGKSSLSTDAAWTRMITWAKDLVDWYGYDKLVRFQAGAGDEFSAQNAFERGKIALMIDGEYRTAFIEREHPELNYGTAPMPVDDQKPELYGGGYITGSIVGIPKGAKHAAAAWELLKYLAYDDEALAKLSNGLRNVPTTNGSLKDPTLKPSPEFATFLKIFTNEHSTTNPVSATGIAYLDAANHFIEKYQAGKGGDLKSGLQKADKQIDDQLQQATAGQAP